MRLRKPGMTAKLHKLSSASLFCGVKLIVCLLIFKYFSHNFRPKGQFIDTQLFIQATPLTPDFHIRIE